MKLTLDYVIIAATVVLLLISVYTDVRYRKIYNAVTVPFAVLGLALNIGARGWGGILFSLGGIAIGLALFFLSALLGRILGAGDCKLFAAVGAFVGPQMLIWCVLYGLVAGGVIALIVALAKGILRPALTRVWRSVYMRAYQSVPMDIGAASTPVRLPYAVAICVGTLFAIWQYHGHF